jgi:hypothetical protein
MTDGYRIGWLDSCRMPARIHRTYDGKVTICGHDPPNHNWILSNVPHRIRGVSRYCRTCFAGVKKKSLPWFPTCEGERSEHEQTV